jgi:transposase
LGALIKASDAALVAIFASPALDLLFLKKVKLDLPDFADTFMVWKLEGKSDERGQRVAPYAPVFRKEMVELVASGRSPSERAKKLVCSDASIHAGVKKSGGITYLPRRAQVMQAAQAVRGVASQMALSRAGSDELMRLRKENKALRAERDILSNEFGS